MYENWDLTRQAENLKNVSLCVSLYNVLFSKSHDLFCLSILGIQFLDSNLRNCFCGSYAIFLVFMAKESRILGKARNLFTLDLA